MFRGSPHVHRRGVIAGVAGLAATWAAGSRARADSPSQCDDNATLERRIGQMVIIGFRGDEGSPGAAAASGWLRRGQVGGVVLFQDNLTSREGAKRLTTALRDAARPLPAFICIDQEGGAVARLRRGRGFNEPLLPSAQSIAAMSIEDAAHWYERSAGELKDLGFNVDLGPVVDLSLNHDSRIISGLGRSFGADPETVTRFARIFIRSFHKLGMLTAIKHFPGHGSTPFDSHSRLPDITGSWSEKELIPFSKLTGETDMVMAGHLVHAQLTGPGTPASLSALAIVGLLRDKLGFTGPVITDDMQMEAIGDHYGADESIVLGIEGGADLFIFTNLDHPDAEMPERFIRVVRGAVESGRIAPSRIDESFERIRRLKARLGCVGGE